MSKQRWCKICQEYINYGRQDFSKKKKSFFNYFQYEFLELIFSISKTTQESIVQL